jgi:uncharacterized membrane protein
MNPQRALIAAAAASLLSTALYAGPVAPQAGKEKCYGIAKAGQNDCANLSGSHSCAGQTQVNGDASDWKYVSQGECKAMKGLSADEAKMKAKKV